MHAETTLSPAALRRLWLQLAEQQDLPDRYELTEHGELVVSPKPTNRHQLLCAEVAFQLRTQLGGLAVVEAAVLTAAAGVRVPDVVWMPSERWKVVTTAEDLLEAPDLVVEVLSPGNRKTEVEHKVQAYLASGIREVIVIGLLGELDFHSCDGCRAASAFGVTLTLAPEWFRRPA
ncbi:Uma2 family endonuclease [Aquabacterium sp. A7-Y]|uniref:Uma2 family endonuclease n=1 Tax=Aquabacterium sp. A7-Y TaxID=1349605 RepID=UPI00223DB425|nr:Uma2 family endonuclease [Aquabacterium sp. A7-Y]MCW7537950.1 Uma2 family endonuclease [Aquabacterium sp. A7-Y]